MIKTNDMKILAFILWFLLGLLYWYIWHDQRQYCCHTEGSTSEFPAAIAQERAADSMSMDTAWTTTERADTPSVRKMQRTVYFAYNSVLPIAGAQLTSFLDSLVIYCREHPEWHVRIIGHTDDLGDEQTNLNIGLERAQSVGMLLLNRGGSTDRIKMESSGESNPITNNTSEEGRALNRRVEIYLDN